MRSGVAEIDLLGGVFAAANNRRCQRELFRGKIGSIAKLLMN
jgi:hypothetical protein